MTILLLIDVTRLCVHFIAEMFMCPVILHHSMTHYYMKCHEWNYNYELMSHSVMQYDRAHKHFCNEMDTQSSDIN